MSTFTSKASARLKWIVGKMDERYKQLQAKAARNIEGYNREVPVEEKLPYWVVVVDELADLMMVSAGEVQNSLVRLAQIAREALSEAGDAEIDLLALDRLTSEYGRNIHPCKACYSTSPALCHWPCSCYPNYALGQTQDWMNEIYPMWVAAHGIMIITPVNWYQVSSPISFAMFLPSAVAKRQSANMVGE